MSELNVALSLALSKKCAQRSIQRSTQKKGRAQFSAQQKVSAVQSARSAERRSLMLCLLVSFNGYFAVDKRPWEKNPVGNCPSTKSRNLASIFDVCGNSNQVLGTKVLTT